MDRQKKGSRPASQPVADAGAQASCTPVIVEQRVVSKPGAAIRVTEYTLSADAQRGLTANVQKLGDVT